VLAVSTSIVPAGVTELSNRDCAVAAALAVSLKNLVTATGEQAVRDGQRHVPANKRDRDARKVPP
jgi:hypothetical protein